MEIARVIDPTETEADSVEVGQWYWVKREDGDPWFACVTSVGSNYAKVESPHGSFLRIHFDNFAEQIERREYDPDKVIKKNIDRHREAVRVLLDEIKQLTARLGLTPIGALPEHGEQEKALVVAHGTKNIKAHKKALIKAKEKTLPDLFKKVREEHEEMATWMKSQLIPMKAETKHLEKSTEVIEDRIFTVELYAGLCEELVLIKKGKPASNDEKVHLFQRRHYMDEECLVDYQAGGMEFKDVGAFDRWLLKNKNRSRILPFPKCMVAFRVRREDKKRDGVSITDFIEMRKLDEVTFVYIRNGDSYYRMNTEIDFGAELFPDKTRSHILGGALYVNSRGFGSDVITEQTYNAMQEDQAQLKLEYEQKLDEWRKTPKSERKSIFAPYYNKPYDRYEPLTPDSVYYDDGMQNVGRDARDHNRISVVLQGLLDRSPAFHPHPPWRLWTPEGFTAGIELVYDSSRNLTDGDPPDFKAYRDRLNESIKKGTHTVGQENVWLRVEARKENDRQARDWRVRYKSEYKFFSPYGNEGPGLVAEVTAVGRDGKCKFTWERERLRYKWGSESTITTHFRCSTKFLLNVDAYEVGDFKIFYADPRTRADYLKWAPLLLAAEDFKAKERNG